MSTSMKIYGRKQVEMEQDDLRMQVFRTRRKTFEQHGVGSQWLFWEKKNLVYPYSVSKQKIEKKYILYVRFVSFVGKIKPNLKMI